MKTTTLYILLAFLPLTNTIVAQDDDPISMDVFDLVEEDFDVSGEFLDSVFNTNRTDTSWEEVVDQINDQINDRVMKLYMQRLTLALKELEAESYTGKCLQVMGAYAELLAYCDRRVEDAATSCEKKEWLGAEGLILLAGSSMNYCPLEFYGLSDESLNFDEQSEIKAHYNNEITTYFFGKMLSYGGKFENREKSKEFEERTQQVLQMNIDLYYDKKGKNSYDELTEEEKEELASILTNVLEDSKRLYKFEIPHMFLYWKFVKANQQLGLQNKLTDDSSGLNGVDFVGKMFTPEFMLAKTLEIAKLSNLYKCTN